MMVRSFLQIISPAAFYAVPMSLSLASGPITIDVIANSPALGIGLHALLQLEDTGRRFLWGTRRDGIRFLIGKASQPCFERQSRPLGQSHGHLIQDKFGILLR
jgi:hypothetical protein